MNYVALLAFAVVSASAAAQAPQISSSSVSSAPPIPDVPQTPVEVSAVRESDAFRLRTTETSLALYTFDQDGEDCSACVGRCADNWPPVMAPPGSAALGEWKPITRSDGRLQWSFRGRPVYSYRGDTPSKANGDGLGGQWHLVQPISFAPSPRPVSVALAVEGSGPAVPIGVGIGKSAGGAAIFTDLHGYAIYAFGRDAEGKSACVEACARLWPPLVPPPTARPVGDWTIVPRTDGSAQWAYKGRPAYIHSRDKPNGGETGHGQGGLWHLMAF